MKLRLDTITNVVTLLTCVAIIVVLVQRSQRGAIGPSPTYKVGETITELPMVSFGSVGRTLLLAASERCRYCQESAPFYKTLATQLANVTPPGSVQLVLVTLDDQATSERFLLSAGLGKAKVVRLVPDDMNALKVPGTPTLVLADRQGKVVGVWVGKLDAEGERQVLAELATGKG